MSQFDVTFDALCRTAAAPTRRSVLYMLGAFALDTLLSACDPTWCEKGLTKCGTICVDILRDRSFCGGCGGDPSSEHCGPNTFCNQGKCSPCPRMTCGEGFIYDPATCECKCAQTFGCPHNQHFDNTTCDCECDDPNKKAWDFLCCNLGVTACGQQCCSWAGGCCQDGSCPGPNGECCRDACDPGWVCCKDAFGDCCPPGYICSPNLNTCVVAPSPGSGGPQPLSLSQSRPRGHRATRH